ncbi:MAG: helix-turn-helix domain-containing protein [Clostridiaceae bacterium]|nr:helix-turn-helix domain-containing protein [Clostridiaceae bacterium]
MLRLFDMNREQLKALAEYRDVLDKGQFFRRNFWQDEKTKTGIHPNCQVITRYCFEYIEGITPDMLPGYNLKQLKEILAKNRLSGMLQTVFNNDVVEVLKNAYPDEFKKRTLAEWMWSRHGTWKNDKYVIEAVQYMVLREGIRRVELIPEYDWKKRLLKYGIYNILSRFDWCIYKLFDFVYPGRFHPADFKYKTKWRTDSVRESYENAFRLMSRVFSENRLCDNDIMLLNNAGFRKLGLISMLLTLFDGKPLIAKEFYFYRTIGNTENQEKLKEQIRKATTKREDETIKKRLSQVSTGRYIYNLHANSGLYSYLKRCASKRGMKINELVAQFGFIYKSSRAEQKPIDPEEIRKLRKEGLTYAEIAARLESNPTTISSLCRKYFGGDPLIPRPIDDYITVQELMDRHRIDHKTIMKLVQQNNFENHVTIRHRYLKKSEIIPSILEYKKQSLHHKALINRYGG